MTTKTKTCQETAPPQPAATAVRVTRPRPARGRLVQADEAGPVPVWEAGHPLTLTEGMRVRLREAVHALMADPGLVGEPDSARLGAVVLAAKTNVADLEAEALVTAGELGRWLGVKATTVRHEVRKRLQRGAVASWDVVDDVSARTVGIRWRVQTLWAARHQGRLDDPLRLTRPELATLLRLVEALFGPGWRHQDGAVTAPGLLAWRTGHGAATDRLALLLVVLDARPDGSVRLCGGPVDEHGRVVATLARLLGCDTAAAKRVLGRLEGYEAVRREVTRGGRERLVVPAVAEAYRRLRAAQRAAGRSPAPSGGGADRARGAGEASAGGDQNPASLAKQQVNAGDDAGEGGKASASLHADHSLVGAVVGEVADVCGCSGSAEGGCCGRRERACAREEPAGDPASGTVPRPRGEGEGALRAEPPSPQPSPASSPLSPGLARRVPQVAGLLAEITPPVNDYQRGLLDRLVNGLLLDGEDDTMIAARLRQRLAKIATGDPSRPYAFRRGGLAWALNVGLPYTPGGRTLVPCSSRGCRNLVRARATSRAVRCDPCELAAMQAAWDAEWAASRPDPSTVPSPPPLEVLRAQLAVDEQPADAPVDAGGDGDQDVADGVELPGSVRAQLAALAGIDPRVAQRAEEAARTLYGPAPDGETPEEHRDRVANASSAWFSLTDRYADQLAAHAGRAA